MTEPVMESIYWKERLQNCNGELHRAIFNGSIDQFSPLEIKHRQILSQCIRPRDSVLDAGCGYGRLLWLMPERWKGNYIGVDIAKEFLDIARIIHPNRNFIDKDLRHLDTITTVKQFDVGIICSVKSMIIRHCGIEVWNEMQRQLNRSCKRLLFLDYGEWD